MLKYLSFSLALFAAGTACADTTAIYKSPKLGGEMTVEVSSNGDVRGTVGSRGDYVITRDGEGYFVFFTDKGVVVDRVSDASAVMADYFRENLRKVMPEPEEMPAFDGPKFIAGGVVTVQGRAGTIWYTSLGNDGVSPDQFSTVISADPALAELGVAMARQFEISTLMLGNAMGRNDSFMGGMLDALRTGAPLRFAGMELMSVTHTPIAPDRFALPAEPETREQVRARFVANGGHIP